MSILKYLIVSTGIPSKEGADSIGCGLTGGTITALFEASTTGAIGIGADLARPMGGVMTSGMVDFLSIR